MCYLGLSMHVIATCVGHDVSTIQGYVAGGCRTICEHVEDPFATSCDIRSRLPPSKCVSASTQTNRNRLHEVRMTAQQAIIGVLLNARNRAACLAGCLHYYSWTNEQHQVMFTDESCFYLCTNDGYGRLRCFQQKWLLAGHIIERHTAPIPSIMFWRGIIFGRRTALVHILRSLIAERYFNQVILAVVLPLVQDAIDTLFQLENIQPHVAQRTVWLELACSPGRQPWRSLFLGTCMGPHRT